MELRQIAATLWKWAWLLILATAVAAASSWWVVKDQPPIYQTSTTVMIGTTIQQVSPNYTEFYTAERLAQTYSQLIRREPVLKATAAALGFEDQWRALRGQVTAQLVAGTELMEIRVIDTDPIRAKQIADEVTRQLMATVEAARPQGTSRAFIQEQVAILPGQIQKGQAEIQSLQEELAQAISAREIQDLKSQISALETQVNNWRSTFAQYQLLLGDTGVNVLTVIEEAAIPTVPAGNQGMMQVALAASIGLMLALGAAFLIEYLDDTVKSPQDVERKTGLPTFGVIIRFPPSADGEGPVTALEPRSSIAEGYRVLRTNLQFATLGLNKPSTVLLVTSAQPTEGKTTTVANLGVSLAQAGKKVLLVDADLRRPSLHKLFKLSKDIGLTSLLIEREANLDYVVHKTGIENLSVLPSGPVPANPAEVLGFPEMSALIERLRGLADYVVLDSPPVLSVADTSVLAQKVDGVLMVVEAGLTRTGMFERAVSVLQGVKAKLLGSILTKVGAHRGAYSYDYYYYYSSYYTEDGTHKRTRRHRDRSLLGRIRHWFRRGRRSEHRSSSGTSASGAAPPAPDGAAGPATLAEGAAPVRSLAAGEASARGGAACAAPGEPPPAEGSPARPFDQPLEPPPEDEEESPEGATVALTLRPASADRPQVLTTVLDEAAPRPTEPPESVTAPPLPFPAAAEQEAPAAPWVPPEGPLPFVPLAEEPAARPAPAPLPAEEPAPAAPPVEAAPPPSPPAEQPEPEAPSAPARRRFSFWPFRRRTSPPPAPPVPASPAPTTEALLATEPPETVPAPHEPAAAGPPPQPAPPLPAPAEPLVPVPPVGLAPHAIEPAAESPLPPEPLEYDEAEQEAAASVLPLPVTALPPEPPTVLPMIADDLAPATAPGEPELMIAPSESPLPPEPPEYEEAEEEAAASVLPLPPAGPPPEPPAILPSTTEDLAPAMAPGEPELMIAPAEPEPPAAQPGPELRQEPAPPPAELEPAITAPLAAEPEPEPALPAPEPPAPLAVEPAEPAVAPTAVERQPAPPVPCPPATPADAETAEADALFAEALDLYRHHELKGARETLLRLATIDPRRRGVESLLREVEGELSGELDNGNRPGRAPRPRRSILRPVLTGLLLLALVAAVVAALAYSGFLPSTWAVKVFGRSQVQKLITRGYNFFILDDYPSAIASFNEALAIDPNNAEARQGLQNATRYQELRGLYDQALALMKSRAYDQAATIFQSIIKIDPWYKDADRLLTQCQTALDLQALHAQAEGYYAAGDWARAVSAFRDALSKGIDDPDGAVRARLLDSYVNQGRQEIALATTRSAIIHATQSFNSALALDSTNAVAQKERQLASQYLDAFTAYDSGDWRRAVSELTRILADQPDYGQGQAVRLLCSSHLKLGDSYQATGQTEPALQQYSLVLTHSSCDPAEAQSRINALTATPTPLPTTAN